MNLFFLPLLSFTCQISLWFWCSFFLKAPFKRGTCLKFLAFRSRKIAPQPFQGEVSPNFEKWPLSSIVTFAVSVWETDNTFIPCCFIPALFVQTIFRIFWCPQRWASQVPSDKEQPLNTFLLNFMDFQQLLLCCKQ